MPQQRSDDPRRGGKVGIEVRGAWNKDPNVEIKLGEATEYKNLIDHEIGFQ